MTSSGSMPAKFKTDHPRAIDGYIDYFGDCAATGTERLARRIMVVVAAHVETAIRAVLASRPVPRS